MPVDESGSTNTRYSSCYPFVVEDDGRKQEKTGSDPVFPYLEFAAYKRILDREEPDYAT